MLKWLFHLHYTYYGYKIDRLRAVQVEVCANRHIHRRGREFRDIGRVESRARRQREILVARVGVPQARRHCVDGTEVPPLDDREAVREKTTLGTFEDPVL